MQNEKDKYKGSLFTPLLLRLYDFMKQHEKELHIFKIILCGAFVVLGILLVTLGIPILERTSPDFLLIFFGVLLSVYGLVAFFNPNKLSMNPLLMFK